MQRRGEAPGSGLAGSPAGSGLAASGRAGEPAGAGLVGEAIAAHAAGVPGIGSPSAELCRAVRPDGTAVAWQEFTAGGAMFHTGSRVCHVMVDVYRKYRQLGGGDTATAVTRVGAPLGDTRPALIGPDPAPPPPGLLCGSREAYHSEFDHGSIYWSEKTGARLVRGEIRAEWRRLGGAYGPLGLPVEDERADGPVRYSDFERGTIWLAPDGSVNAIGGLRVEFTGFRRMADPSVEPVYFAVHARPLERTRERDIEQAVWATPLPLSGTAYQGTDKPARVTVFRGRPAPFEVTILGWRHGDGDPYAFRHEIAVGVAAAGAGAAVARGDGAMFLNADAAATISSAVSRALASGDDFVGGASWRVGTRRELLELLATDPARRGELELRSPDGAVCYRPGFEIVPVAVGKGLP
ncbi:MAG: LGFP repeat-containing protein [Micromonosporaceae bacterium]